MSSGWNPERIRKHFLTVNTIFDVGVGHGTFPLYQSFPDCFFVLVEPNPFFAPSIDKILARYNGELVQAAVGSCDGEAELVACEGDFPRASLKERSILTANRRAERRTIAFRVDVLTLDTIIARKQYSPPYGLKIDTEGFEYEAIRGASTFLSRAEFVLAEVSVASRFSNSYRFHELIRLLADNGFELYDILEAPRITKLNDIQWNGTLYIDGLFVRTDLFPLR